MNKEQIAFVVVLALLGAIWFLGGPEDEPVSRRRSKGQEPEAQPALELGGRWIGADDSAWSVLARNPFLAPRDTDSLDPVQLAPPPLPRLPHPGLPLIPAVGGDIRTKLRHDLVPDPKIALPPPGARTVAPAAGAANGGGEEAGADLNQVDTSNVGVIESEAAKLRMSVEEKERARRLQEEARKAESERKKGLDSVVWIGGDTAYGTLVELDKKDSVYVIKDRIDRLRGNSTLPDLDRTRQLEGMKLVFREDKGAGKPAVRTVVSAVNVQRLDFAPASAVRKYHLARLHAPPDDLARQEELAKLVYDAGELQLASTHLEEMVAKGLATPKVHALCADAWRRLFRYDQELKALERGLAAHPEDVGLLARLGQICLRLQVPARAAEAFQKALALDPSHALTRLGLGQVHVLRGEAAEALVHLRQAETGTGLDKEQQTRVLLLLGETFLLQGNLGSATPYFDLVLGKEPTHPRALCGAAVAAFASSGPAAAKALVDRGREAHPIDGGLAYLDALCLLRGGKYVEARDALLLVEQLDPLLTAPARTAMSWLLEKVGQDEAALAAADQALVADPLNQEARLQHARTLLNVGDLDGARAGYVKALEGAPDRVDILVALGDTAFRSGSYPEAARFYARAQAREAGFPDLLGRRLVCDVRRSRLAEADEHMKRVDANLENNPFVQAAQALYFYAKGQSEEALRKFRILGERKIGPVELLAFADASLKAVDDNQSKEVWKDQFNRSGGQLLKDWKREIGAGINIAVVDGRARLEGTQRKVSDDPTVLYQERGGRLFYSYSVDLDMKPQAGAYMGCGIMAFQQNPKVPVSWPGLQNREGRLYAHLGLQVALAPHGKLVWRKIYQGAAAEWAEVPETTYSGGPVSITIELVDAQKSVYRVLVGAQPVLPSVDIPGLSRRPGALEMQVFCQAQIEKPVQFTADNVSIVTYRK